MTGCAHTTVGRSLNGSGENMTWTNQIRELGCDKGTKRRPETSVNKKQRRLNTQRSQHNKDVQISLKHDDN